MELGSRRGLAIIAGRAAAGMPARLELALLEALMVAAMAAFALALLA